MTTRDDTAEQKWAFVRNAATVIFAERASVGAVTYVYGSYGEPTVGIGYSQEMAVHDAILLWDEVERARAAEGGQ